MECSDQLAAKLNLDGPQPLDVPDVPKTGNWYVSKMKNPLDGSETATAVLIAESGASKWGDKVSFFARCKSGKTEAFINWGDYLGDDIYRSRKSTKQVTPYFEGPTTAIFDTTGATEALSVVAKTSGWSIEE